MESYEVTIKFSIPSLDHDGRLDELDDCIHAAMKDIVSRGLAAEASATLEDGEAPFLYAPHGPFPGVRARLKELKTMSARTIKHWEET